MGLCCGKSSVPVVEQNRPIQNSQKSVKLPDTTDVSLKKEEETHRRHKLLGQPSEQKTAKDQTTDGQTKTNVKSKKPSWIFGKRRNQAQPIKTNMNEKSEKPSLISSKKIDQVHPIQTNIDEKSKKPFWIFGKEKKQDHPIQTNINEKSKKPSLIFRKKKNQVHPIKEDVTPKKLCPAAPKQEVTIEIKPPQEKEKKPDVGKTLIQTLIQVKQAPSTMITKFFRCDQFRSLGLPNPAQYCYMNSCLQSLLTIEDFVSSISCQEQIWGSLPEAAILRSFMEVKKAYGHPDLRKKIPLLDAFKRAISLRAPEFRDFDQKDAHEFLTCVFQQIRNLGPQLNMMAASMDKSYRCPVETLMTFKMENTRTCRSCGVGSIRQEEFTNLSLDLIPGCETVDELLTRYLEEINLEFRCDCGSVLSGQRSVFATLPRVLVLHLKRFRFTPSYKLKKVCDPILLNRDLVVTTKQDGYCYSLVSVINHMGKHARAGHYICDGVDPDVKVDDPTDRWFTYDDAWVSKTSGANVCNQRQRNAYIVFYKRQD